MPSVVPEFEPARSFARPTVSSAAALTVVALPTFLLGAFAPTLKQELGFGDAALGALFSAGYFVSAAGLHFGGRLADERGVTPTLRAGVGIAAVACLVMSLTADSYLVLIAIFLAIRVAESLVHPATNALISQAVPVHQQGRSLGVKQSAIPLSTALAGIAVPVLGGSIGWRGTFAIVAIAAVPVFLTLPHRPAPAPRLRTNAPSLWRVRHLQLIGIGGGLAAASVVTVGGFLTTAGQEAGFSEGEAGLLLGMGGMLMIASRVTWGWLADRFRFDRFLAVAASVAIGSVSFLLFATESKPMLIAGTALAFGVAWSWPGIALLGVIELHPDAPGAASAVIQSLVRLGALASPLLFGVIADRYGFSAAWMLSFACAASGVVMMLLGSIAAKRFTAATQAPEMLGLDD
jgi:MFS family permease